MSKASRLNQISVQNERELESQIVNTSASWHEAYKKSAYIVISNLNIALTEGDIIIVTSQYGEIVDIKLLRDFDGYSKGIAFVGYFDQRSTNLAVDNLNGIELAGKIITVDHSLSFFRKINEDELIPYLIQQMFGIKEIDVGENRHLDSNYKPITENEYEILLDLVEQNRRSYNNDELLNLKNQQKSYDSINQLPKESKISKKRKRTKEERDILLREYQERCKQSRESKGVISKKVDGHMYGLATGFDVRYGENRKEISTREAYEKLHGYVGIEKEIKTTGRADVDALEKYAYDMRKKRRDEDLILKVKEEKAKLIEKAKKHDEKLEKRIERLKNK